MPNQVVQVKKPNKRKGLGVSSGKKEDKKKKVKSKIGTVYSSKLKKCVPDRKKGESLLQMQQRIMMDKNFPKKGKAT